MAEVDFLTHFFEEDSIGSKEKEEERRFKDGHVYSSIVFCLLGKCQKVRKARPGSVEFREQAQVLQIINFLAPQVL